MAKKEKVELTPEELEAKKARRKEKRGIFGKTFTRVLAWMLAIVLVYAVTYMAFGKPVVTTAVSGGNATQQSGGQANKNDWDTTPSGNGGGTQQSDSQQGGTQQGGTQQNSLNVASKADAAKLLNEVTAAAKAAGYNYSKITDYEGDGMKLDSKLIQTIGDGVLGALNPPTSISNVVAGFIEIGEKNGTFAKGNAIGKDNDGNELKDKESLKATKITEADIVSFSVSGDVLKLTIASSEDPERNDGTAVSRLTNDFLNKGDVVEALADQDQVPATLKEEDSTVSYTETTVEATIKDGKLTNLKYELHCEARVAIDIVKIVIKGSGTAKRTIIYSGLVY